jgi:uracil-DNA glycosylase
MDLEKVKHQIRKEDSKGNYIRLDPQTLNVLLRDNSTKERNIGSIKENDGKLVYHKHEEETQIHRKSKSWSINRNVLEAVDVIEYETDRGIYRINSQKARSLGFSYKWDNKSFVDKKCYVPIKLWDTEWNNPTIGSLVSRFGYEWFSELELLLYEDYVIQLGNHLGKNYASYPMYPAKENIFAPFKLTSYMDVKVVMVAPYAFPFKGSNGLAFGIEGTGSVPMVTTQLLKEIEWDIYQGCLMLSFDTTMRSYADQGVLLLNYIATSSSIRPSVNIGWERFTGDVISLLNERKENIVFMLYGAAAELQSLVSKTKHMVIANAMPYTPEYVRDNYFSKCNNYLVSNKIQSVNW